MLTLHLVKLYFASRGQQKKIWFQLLKAHECILHYNYFPLLVTLVQITKMWLFCLIFPAYLIYFTRPKQGAAVCLVATRMVKVILVSCWNPWRRRMSGTAPTSCATLTSCHTRRLRRSRSWLNPGLDENQIINDCQCTLSYGDIFVYIKFICSLTPTKFLVNPLTNLLYQVPVQEISFTFKIHNYTVKSFFAVWVYTNSSLGEKYYNLKIILHTKIDNNKSNLQYFRGTEFQKPHSFIYLGCFFVFFSLPELPSVIPKQASWPQPTTEYQKGNSILSVFTVYIILCVNEATPTFDCFGLGVRFFEGWVWGILELLF